MHQTFRAHLTMLALVTALTGCNAIADWDGVSRGAALKADEPNASGAAVETKSAPIVGGVTTSEVSGEHSCAVGGDGTIRCWGRNSVGQLGVGDTNDRLRPTLVKGIVGAKALAAGPLHTCATDAEDLVWCWGNDTYFAVGRGPSQQTVYAEPEQVLQTPKALRIAAGMDFTCIIDKAARVECWGTNTAGQLGDGSTLPARRFPAVIPSLEEVRALSAANQHACAVADAGDEVYCWGNNTHRQLGETYSVVQKTPQAVQFPLETLGQLRLDVVTGDGHTCAILDDHSLWCWGQNDDGQLGSPASPDTAKPQRVALDGVQSVSVGSSHTCAIADYKLYCWGSNAKGQLGIASAATHVPTRVADGIQTVTTRGAHTCALRSDRKLLCWGDNAKGQLGSGSRAPLTTPTEVAF